jgi:hypothetical protein
VIIDSNKYIGHLSAEDFESSFVNK